jgi:iron complex outermembrane recepter protein
LLDLELGARSSLLQNAVINDLSVSINGYYMGFKDEILKTGHTDHFGSSIVANADKSLHYGLETSIDARFADWISLALTFTQSHNEIIQFSKYSDTASVDGKVPIGFPSTTGGLMIMLAPLSGLNISITGRYVGSFYGDIVNSDLYKNAAYFVFNGSVSCKISKVLGISYLQFKVTANNLTNTLYTSYVERDAGFFVGAPFNLFAQMEIGL